MHIHVYLSLIQVIGYMHVMYTPVACVHLQRLWKLLVEDSDLMGHLHVSTVCIRLCSEMLLLQFQIIKDFFLLGRGELYLAFVDLAHSFMRLPPTTTTQHGTATVKL